MSKANNQAIFQLFILAGCWNTLAMRKSFARIDLKRGVEKCLESSLLAIEHWPERDSFSKKDLAWVNKQVAAWKKHVEDDPDDNYSDAMIVKMCLRICEALYETLKNREKRAMVASIVEFARELDRYVDSRGTNHPAYEHSDYVMGKLFENIGMGEYA